MNRRCTKEEKLKYVLLLKHGKFDLSLTPEWIRQSMSRKENCLDNGIMESSFWMMKNKMFYDHDEEFKTFDELKRAVEAYIAWYNSKRIVERLRWQTR